MTQHKAMIQLRQLARLAIALLLGLTTGCAALNLPQLKQEGQPDAQKKGRQQEPIPAERKAEVLRDFEARRDQAEYQAALSRWNQGDNAGCRKTLKGLLSRSPGHLEGSLLLAELMLLEDQAAEAQTQIEKVLAEHPDDARVQHTMGLLLEAQGQTARATGYFERAATLDPENDVYALSLETATASVRPKPASAPPRIANKPRPKGVPLGIRRGG